VDFGGGRALRSGLVNTSKTDVVENRREGLFLRGGGAEVDRLDHKVQRDTDSIVDMYCEDTMGGRESSDGNQVRSRQGEQTDYSIEDQELDMGPTFSSIPPIQYDT
jgi:hypothetical protein